MLVAAGVLALAGLGGGAAQAQVSPGPLAQAHRELDGAVQCLQCHGRGTAMDERCLACHTEVAWMKTQKRGLHARTGSRTCAGCHPDHGGRDFRLVAWDGGAPERFDHTRAGWPLEGRHAALECRACHRPELQRSAAAPRIRKRDRSGSWLGIETGCVSCHRDVHRGQLGADCRRCHDERAWKPLAGFDHAKTRYPLDGKHAELACAKCHLAAGLALARDEKGLAIPQWKPLPHAECSACHRDPHAGKLGAACATCHVTGSFLAIRRGAFDHDRTRYPLRGKHATVDCASCHEPERAWGAKPGFARCDDCHRDAHGGQATVAGKPADCAACHRVEGYSPSTYTVAAHQQSAYPLAGRHVAAACGACHPKRPEAGAAVLGAARVALRRPHQRCEDCHHDPHGGRFAAAGERPRRDGCLACHSLGAFRPAGVTVAVHATFGWPLEGAHRAAPCLACHRELEAAPARSTVGAPPGARTLRFAGKRARCEDCHRSPHGEQFAARADRGACEGCHGLEAWAPAGRFDHRRDAAFPLDGAHARVACAACHRTERTPQGPRVVWRPVASRCESCHATLPAAAGRTSYRPEAVPTDTRRAREAVRLLTTREVIRETQVH